MRKLLALILFCLSFFCGSAQIMTAEQVRMARQVRADLNMEQWVWAIGVGEDIESADNSALRNLTQHAMTQTTIVDTSLKNTNSGAGVKSDVTTSSKSVGIANIYMENVHRIILQPEQGQQVVLRYMSREDWDNRENLVGEKILSYIDAAQMMTSPEDILRCYSWAYLLLRSYNGKPITIKGLSASQYLLTAIRTLLDDINISVIGVKQDKENKNYPYTLYLDFTYQGEPIPSICFAYFDGSGTVEGESVKDGRSTIVMKKLPDTMNITIDCTMIELARQADPTVAVLIPSAPSFDGSVKEVETTPKGVKVKSSFDSTSPKVNSAVQQSLKNTTASYAKVETVSDTAPYTKIMTEIAGSFTNLQGTDIRHHFTDSAWSDYKKIVAEGNPTLARTPEWSFARLDSLVICRQIPIKLKFKGNKSFVEDVVFRINASTKKIESVAYKLGTQTEKQIMAKEWDERDRLTLITFLEDYRTAYCLRDMAYIKKVFSDDAYIIVGKVLQPSKKKYGDKTELINTDGKAVYTQYSKKEYLENLQRSFTSKEFVNIRFEECDVEKGYNTKEGIYAVQVRQLYYSNNYADDGILTLAIDMRREANPLVRVRVWQQKRDVTYTAEQMIVRTVSTGSDIN